MNTAKNVIEYLEWFRQRKDMYIQPVSVETASSFLDGFYLACIACGLVKDRSTWVDAAVARGWNTGAASPIPAMLESGLGTDGTIDELVSIYKAAIDPTSNS